MRLDRTASTRRKRANGLATIVVLAILAILGTLLVVNARVLSRMKAEIQLLERSQTRKFQGPAGAATNAPPRL